MSARLIGILVIAAGVVAVLVGILILAGGFGWFGRLPGDVRIEKESTRVYVPITSMILLSAALTLVVNLVFWIARRVLG